MNVAMEGLLKSKVVVITASAGAGIGLATAQRALEEGATVIISDTHNDGRHLLSDRIEGGSHSGDEEANGFEE
jgi:NAD(P)-dependent dehydrogenase (short-subunit alcohol dehydrogenase family)